MGSVGELKQQIGELSSRRAVLEDEITACSARLESTGVGLHGNLVDAEGFPRSDIDVHAARTDRHKVITLNNDYKELTTQIEMLLHRLHALTRDEGSQAPRSAPLPHSTAELPAGEAGVAAPIGVPSGSSRPFAMVDELAEGSPAREAGVKLGFRLIRFGHVTGQTPNPLQAVARLLQESEGREVESEWLHEGRRVAARLTPQAWAGRGLLGCHLQPLR